MAKNNDIARNENPGVRRTPRAQGEVTNKNIDEPWTSNYPPLHDWLMNSEARCDWQLRYGKGGAGFMLEQWRMPGSLPFIVLVHTKQAGWDVFTPTDDRAIEATLADVRARIFPRGKIDFRFQTPEGWSQERLDKFAADVKALAKAEGVTVLVSP